MSKPWAADGYDPAQSAHVRATCLYVATKLGDLLEEVVVVGGLVPYLLVDQSNLPAGSDSHSGTMGLDMGLALAILNEALSIIERDFCRHDGLGPVGTAQFMARDLDDEIQADVVGYAHELLRSMGRR